LLRVLREQLADLRRLSGLVALERLDLHPGRGRDRLALHVVHELGGDALVRARHDETRPLGRPAHLAANAAMAALARLGLREDAHALLPTFRRTYSPS